MLSSEGQWAGCWDLEGGADGAGERIGVRPDGIGGVLDGGAAGVQRVDEFVAAEAGEAFSFAAFLLCLLTVLVGGKERLDRVDFLRGAEAGQVIRGGAGDEGGGALDEDGAAGVDARADEVSIEREVRGGIAVLG